MGRQEEFDMVQTSSGSWPFNGRRLPTAGVSHMLSHMATTCLGVPLVEVGCVAMEGMSQLCGG